MTETEHRWVGWRHESVTYCVGWRTKDGVVHPEGTVRGGTPGEPVHRTEEMRRWRCSCGAEIHAPLADDLAGRPCTGSDASHLRHRF